MLIKSYSCDYCHSRFDEKDMVLGVRFKNKLYDLCKLCNKDLESAFEGRGELEGKPFVFPVFPVEPARPAWPGTHPWTTEPWTYSGTWCSSQQSGT